MTAKISVQKFCPGPHLTGCSEIGKLWSGFQDVTPFEKNTIDVSGVFDAKVNQ